MSTLHYLPLPARFAAPSAPTTLTLLAALATTTLASAPAATAQTILEVDLSAGRTIIDDAWRSMGSAILAVDHERDILYVNDAEEPEGIMAFSLATGERIRVLPAREGSHREIAGALVDPDTGCYAVLRKSEGDPTFRVARIYADSALVFTRDAERTTEPGETRTVMYPGANRVSLHAVRRVSGEGCWGMVGEGVRGSG